MNYSKAEIADYINEIASRKISPGGGSASALVVATGAALNLMVINFGISPSADEEKISKLNVLKERQTKLMNGALRFVNDDCVAFTDLMFAISQKSDTPEKYTVAAEVPLNICRVARGSMEIAGKTLDDVKGFITADIACSKNMLIAAFYSAKINVEINLKGMGKGEKPENFRREIECLKKGIDEDVVGIEDKLRKGGIVKETEK